MVQNIQSLATLATTINTQVKHKIEGFMELVLDFPFKVLDFSHKDKENRKISWLFWEGGKVTTLLEKVQDPIFDYQFYIRLTHPDNECYMITTPGNRLSPPRIYSQYEPGFIKCPRLIHPLKSTLDMKLDSWLCSEKNEPTAYKISRVLLLGYEGNKRNVLMEEFHEWVESARNIFPLYQKLRK